MGYHQAMSTKMSHTAGHELLPDGAFVERERMEQYSVRMLPLEARMARRAGAGEFSEGVRTAIKFWAKHHGGNPVAGHGDWSNWED